MDYIGILPRPYRYQPVTSARSFIPYGSSARMQPDKESRVVCFLPSLLASLLPSSYRYRPEGEARREASEARRQARDERNEMRDRRLAREPDGTEVM